MLRLKYHWSSDNVHSFIHSFIHSYICTVIKATYTAKICMQDNKTANATVTFALYNWAIKHYYTSKTR